MQSLLQEAEKNGHDSQRSVHLLIQLLWAVSIQLLSMRQTQYKIPSVPLVVDAQTSELDGHEAEEESL